MLYTSFVDNLSGNEMRKSTLVLIYFLILLFSTILLDTLTFGYDTTEESSVGVETGDWVKYSVKELGQHGLWPSPFQGIVTGIKVEVQNVSGTIVTYRETAYSESEGEKTSSFSMNIKETVSRGCWYYIIATNLSEEDQVGEGFRTLKGTNYEWVTLPPLVINTTSVRNYGGVSREANLLRWSYLQSFFGIIYNCSQEHYWDRKTGFLLERTWEQFALGYRKDDTWWPLQKNDTWSMLQLKIADTNLWEMEISQPNWIPLNLSIFSGFLVGVLIVGIVALISIILYSRGLWNKIPWGRFYFQTFTILLLFLSGLMFIIFLSRKEDH